MSEPTRTFEIPDDPADRLSKTRTAARVIMIDPEDRVLLFRDSDPGLPQYSWWVTPGGGIDPGETEAQAAVREVAEETGAVITEAQLIGPVARRVVVHGYSDEVLEQAECFYLARVEPFEVDTAAFTAEEKLTMLGHRWWTPAELAHTGADVPGAWVWPAELVELIALADRPAEWPRDLGRVTDESTRPV